MRFPLCRFLAVFALMMLFVPAVYADNPSEDSFDLSEAVQIEGEDLFNDTVSEAASGSLSISPSGILNKISDSLLGEIRDCASSISLLLVMAAISGLVTTASASFEKKSAGEAAFFACFTLMAAAALKCFTTALNYGTEVISAMTDFITKLSPVLMLTLAAGGKTVSAAAFRPVLSSAVYIVSIVTEKCLVPLTVYGSVLAVAGNMNSETRLSGFCRLIKSISGWIMAAIMTIFTGISAVYGFASPSLDAVGGKAVKFAVGTLVPVVGSFLSDTLETVVSGTRLMKNAVGTAGIVTLCALCIIPVIKIGVMQLMLRLTSAVAEPIADKRVSSMLWEVSEAVTAVFAIVVMTAVMFIINISIILGATNI